MLSTLALLIWGLINRYGNGAEIPTHNFLMAFAAIMVGLQDIGIIKKLWFK